ncbi:hypothetical protein AB4274_21250 [Vibrio sp. 10N.261.55.A10]|uniref:hypothetical protein n=1 Tax=Vibrio sp. 10N.261.55.A10 TaxID=3229687 RepID=UPI0035501A84
MDIELDQFLEPIAHKKGDARRGLAAIEQAEAEAYALDNDEGLGVRLGFKANMMSRADYIHFSEKVVTIIEASDFKDQFLVCEKELERLKKEDLEQYKSENPDKDRIQRLTETTKGRTKPLRKIAYKPLKAEVMQKWCGSIAISERLGRFHKWEQCPNYRYLILCTDGTDIQVMNNFLSVVQGFCNTAAIFTTSQLKL